MKSWELSELGIEKAASLKNFKLKVAAQLGSRSGAAGSE
jgi:hypothetical protein